MSTAFVIRISIAIAFVAVVFSGCGPDVSDEKAKISCQGTPVVCELRHDTLYGKGQGCALSHACTGFASPCGLFLLAGECTSQPGCGWQQDAFNSYCRGSADDCSSRTSESGCTLIAGCEWAACTGTATDCEQLLSAEQCTAIPGCLWTDADFDG